MPCEECGGLAVEPDKSKPSERVYPGGTYAAQDAFGTWIYPTKPAKLCSYHRRKAEGHFDRDPEYYRFNRGPHEWTHYKSYYPAGSPYLVDGRRKV